MAALSRRRLLSVYNLSYVWLRDGVRAYAQYNPTYKEPIFREDNYEKLLKEVPIEDIETSRRKAALNYQTSSIFYDHEIEKFINHVMRNGKRMLARQLVANAFTAVKHHQLRKYNEETDELKKKEIIISPQEVYHLAIKNTTPMLDLRKLKKSGTWYRIPVAISPTTARFRAIKWIIESAKDKNKTERFWKKLADILISSANGEGKAVQKKIEFHKICEANRGYAHYRWG